MCFLHFRRFLEPSKIELYNFLGPAKLTDQKITFSQNFQKPKKIWVFNSWLMFSFVFYFCLAPQVALTVTFPKQLPRSMAFLLFSLLDRCLRPPPGVHFFLPTIIHIIHHSSRIIHHASSIIHHMRTMHTQASISRVVQRAGVEVGVGKGHLSFHKSRSAKPLAACMWQSSCSTWKSMRPAMGAMEEPSLSTYT